MIAPPLPALGGIGAAPVDHLGLAVPDLETAIGLYRDVLGLPIGAISEMPEHGIRVAFVESANTHLELIAPIGAVSPVRALLGRHTIQDFLEAHPAGGLHHVCFGVPDLGATCAAMARAGIRLLSRGGPVIGASGRPIVFLDPTDTSGILIELKEIG